MEKNVNESHVVYADYFRQRTEPDTSLALHWAGVLSYFSERPAFDVLGRSDPHIARMETGIFIPGHSKWDWDYALHDRRPDVFVITSRGLEQRADFRAAYYRAVREPFRFFVRKESATKLLEGRVRLEDLETGTVVRRAALARTREPLRP
jgi:hypothetical protein